MPVRARQTFLRLAFLSFACRALVPIGLMPSPFGEGGPIKFCHGGSAGAFFQALAESRESERAVDHATHHHAPYWSSDHQGRGEDQTSEHAAWEHCPVGSAFSYAGAASELHFQILALEHAFHRSVPTRPVDLVFVGSYRARAPPIL